MASINQDEETEAMLYVGASISQICTLFSMDSRDVKEKIKGYVTPVGKRNGHPIYSIKDVAAYLVQPPYDMDEFIQRMSIADLPTILRKEYWAGMRSRQLFEKEAAELWPTKDVIDTVAELEKTLRMSLLLTRERVERESELTDKQRNIITKLIDNALKEAHEAVVRRFTERKEEQEAKPEPVVADDDEEEL